MAMSAAPTSISDWRRDVRPEKVGHERSSALMTRTRKRSRLRAWGVSVAKRRGMKRATVAVACKLAVIMHRIAVSGDEFDFGGPAVAAKAA
jgi:transposase